MGIDPNVKTPKPRQDLEASREKVPPGSKHIKEGRRVHVCAGKYRGRNGVIAAGIGPGGLRLRAIEPDMSKVRVRLDSGELITYGKNELNKLETQDRRGKGKQKRLEAQKGGQKKLEAKLQRAKKQRLHQSHLAKK